jgi:hypothetical protein
LFAGFAAHAVYPSIFYQFWNGHQIYLIDLKFAKEITPRGLFRNAG